MTNNDHYLTNQLLTYIGNKRKLLGFLESAVVDVKSQLGKDRVVMLDGFAGTGVVSRLFKKHASKLISNDLELYAEIVGKCYLANHSEVDEGAIAAAIAELNANRFTTEFGEGIVRKFYSPADDTAIQPGERAFYTNTNADVIDNIRRLIDGVDEALRPFCLAPLLHEASVHANTSGVFKGFYKNKAGIGQFGGEAENCLGRITQPIVLEAPVLSPYECEWEMRRSDANQLVGKVEVDIAYFDPPYNQHPYGSNYFMLNVVASYEEPTDVSAVSGIPKAWNKSAYNKKAQVADSFDRLIRDTNAKYILISYNNEGFVSPDELTEIANRHGRMQEIRKQDYPTFRGSRNLANRSKSVDELLFVIQK